MEIYAASDLARFLSWITTAKAASPPRARPATATHRAVRVRAVSGRKRVCCQLPGPPAPGPRRRLPSSGRQGHPPALFLQFLLLGHGKIARLRMPRPSDSAERGLFSLPAGRCCVAAACGREQSSRKIDFDSTPTFPIPHGMAPLQ